MRKYLNRTFILLSVFTFAEYIINFARSVVIAGIFGVSVQTEAFFLAYSLLLMIVLLLGSLIKTTVIPTFFKARSESGREVAWDFVFNFLNIVFLGLFCIIFLIIIFSPRFVPLLIGSYPADIKLLAIRYMKVLSLVILFSGSSYLFTGILNAKKIFALPAFSNLIGSALFILIILGFHKVFGIEVMLYAVLLGSLVPFIVQFIKMLKVSRVKYFLRFNLRDRRVREILQLMAPSLYAICLYQIFKCFESYLAAKSFAGSISILNYARVISEIPTRFFYGIIITIFFPFVSESFAELKIGAINHHMQRLMRLILLFGVPVTILFFFLSAPIIQILFQRGKFSALDTLHTARTLSFFSIGITALLFSSLLTHIYCAMRDTRTLAVIAVFSVIVNVLLDLVLVKTMSYWGLALGYSLATVFSCTALLYLLPRKLKGISFDSVIDISPQLIISGAVMAVFVSLIAKTNWISGNIFWIAAFKVIVITVSSVSIYLAALLFLNVNEAKGLYLLARNKMR